MIDISVIIPFKNNEELSEQIIKQCRVGDEIIIFNQPKFALRKMDDAIKSAKKDVVLIMNPEMRYIPDNFIDVTRSNYNIGTIYMRGWDDDMDGGFAKCPFKNFAPDDCIWFVNGSYRGSLKDFSSHLDFNTILRTIIRPFSSNLLCPVLRRSTKYKEIADKKKIDEYLAKQKSILSEEEIIRKRNELEKERRNALEEYREHLRFSKTPDVKREPRLRFTPRPSSPESNSLKGKNKLGIVPERNVYYQPNINFGGFQRGIDGSLMKPSRINISADRQIRIDEIVLEEDE
jgi:hypothetical protein